MIDEGVWSGGVARIHHVRYVYPMVTMGYLIHQGEWPRATYLVIAHVDLDLDDIPSPAGILPDWITIADMGDVRTARDIIAVQETVWGKPPAGGGVWGPDE